MGRAEDHVFGPGRHPCYGTGQNQGRLGSESEVPTRPTFLWQLTYGERLSPILVRPIREQFEHNRVIRLLVARLRRKFTVGVNIGDEPEGTSVRSGSGLVYPDLVLTNSEGVRRLHGVVEVETGESVNHLEAMAEWVPYGKVRGAFYLYVPAGTTDVARRLCEESRVSYTEIWSFHAVGDQIRFTMAHRSARAAAASRRERKGAKQVRILKNPAKHAKKPTAKTARAAPKAARKPAVSKAARKPAVSKAKAKASKAPRKSTAAKRSAPRSRTAKTVTRVKKGSGARATKRTPSVGPAKSGAKKTTARSRTRR